MTTGLIVSLIALGLSLFLVSRSSSIRSLSFERKAGMTVAWAIIIAVLAFVLSRLGL